MKKERIDLMIEEFEQVDRLDDEAFLGFFYRNNDYAYIKANKKGIIKLIIELMKVLSFVDFHLSRKEGHYSVIPIKSYPWIYRNSHIDFNYLEPKKETRSQILDQLNEDLEKTGKNNFTQWVLNFFGILILIFLVISFLVGIFQVLKWIIQIIF
jgi:hypothetical protein